MISIVLKGVHHAASLLNSVIENHVFLAVQLPDQSEATDPSKFFIILCNGTDSILTNEKYMGDALLQKTYTPNFLTHKSMANNRTVEI